MGDLLEIRTSPKDEQNCYRISSGGLKFCVKGKGKAAIWLASNPYEENKIKIIIGNQYSWIDANNKVKTINTILDHTYNQFWISWYGKEIRIGKGNNSKPFLVEEKLIDTINCISFSSFKQNTLNWKFRLPPKIKEPVYKKINDGQLKWVKMDGNCLPEDALIGGYENEVLYIMRAMHEDALTPGKYVPSKEAGYVAWGYDAHKKTDMEILCGYDGIWVPTEGDRIPQGALVGGYTEYHETMLVGRALHNNIVIPGKIAPSHKILCGYDGIWVPTEGDRIPQGALVGGYTEYHETMYVGRALHNSFFIPGKIAPSHKVCYIPYNGNEISKAIYETLVTPN